jgi:hypothetical protein
MLNRIIDALRDLEMPTSEEVPRADAGARAEALSKKAALKAAALSSGLALPPGPAGLLTLLPDLVGIWRIQSRLVADIAACHGQTACLTRESLFYCVFKHGAAQALRDVAAVVARRWTSKAAFRWLPVAGALGVGVFAYVDTARIGKEATSFFGEMSA